MGAGQHRLVGMALGHFADGVDEAVHRRQHDRRACLFQHQRVGEIVDVLRGAGEVQELADLGDLGVRFGLFLKEILDRLDVVVGSRLDFLDAPGIGDREAGDNIVQELIGGR